MVDCAQCVIFLQVVLYTLSRLSRRAMSRGAAESQSEVSCQAWQNTFRILHNAAASLWGRKSIRTRAFEWHKRFKEGREEI